jgi:hypothetical protein
MCNRIWYVCQNFIRAIEMVKIDNYLQFPRVLCKCEHVFKNITRDFWIGDLIFLVILNEFKYFFVISI